MLRNYFKIFLKVASQNKLFTFLSLFGISLTIMFVMIFSMTITKIVSGSGPEAELKKIIFSDRVKVLFHEGKSQGQSTSACGRILCEEYFKKVTNAKIVSMYTNYPWEFILDGKYQLKYENRTDAEYWDIFKYKFLQGRPYTKDEVISKANFAVITLSLKELLFGKEKDVLGKTIHYPLMNLTVIGVVEDPPVSSQNAKGDLYFPYTLNSGIQIGPSIPYGGEFIVAFKASSSKRFNAIRNEVQDMIKRLDAADTVSSIVLSGPYTQLEKIIAGNGNMEKYSQLIWIFKYLSLALAIILLPAINLMALNFSRIHERCEEIAIRKSFGATSGRLRGQFLFENILMTLTGGLIGIILAYIVVGLLGNSFSIPVTTDKNVPLSFSFNFLIFSIALTSCLIFGLLSGFLPAMRLSRMKPVVYLKGGEL
jgi:putative ABC transport system permease protein